MADDTGAAKKAPAKKAPAKKAPAKAPAKKAPSKKAPAKKAPAKAPAKKAPAKKAPAKKAPAKKAPAKKAPAKKAPAKKAPAKKASAAAAPASDTVAASASTSRASSTKKKPSSRRKASKSPSGRAKALRKSTKKSRREISRTVRDAQETKFFKAAQRRASSIIDSPEKLTRLATESSKSIAENSGPLAEVLDDLKAMIRLVVAYARGNYRDISPETLVLTVAALLYVVMPLDLIPDAIPVVGWLDDAAVVGFVLKQTRSELQRFKEWETGASGAEAASTS